MLNLIDNLVILAAFIGIVAVAIHFAKSSQDMDRLPRLAFSAGFVDRAPCIGPRPWNHA